MSAPAAPIQPAATVVLLRDGAQGIETWLLRRVRQMVFAPDMSVFPGGRVDEGDADTEVPWIGAEPGEDAERFGCTVDQARAALVAAARETFEETGVLITNPSFAGDTSGHFELRRAIEANESSFAQFLIDNRLSVDASLIRPWARWVTPPNETRRYDTFFYVAVLPAGAVALADSTEAVEAGWIGPQSALDEHAAGSRPMLPPTLVQLSDLRAFATAADALAASAERVLAAIRPRFEHTAAGRRLVMPDGSAITLPDR